MDDASRPAANAARAAVPSGPSARLVPIDILRGIAILWVIAFHLWMDMTGHVLYSWKLYASFDERVVAGRALPALTAFTDLVVGLGFLGVPLFMMLSGVSLTLNAYRRGEPRILDGYRQRFRRILPVYWTAILLTIATIATIACLYTLFDGGSFAQHWRSSVRFGSGDPVHVDAAGVGWAISIVGWLVRGSLGIAPIGALWFIPYLLQYYLLFPFALALLRRVGPVRFNLIGIAVTLASRAVFVSLTHSLDAATFGAYLSTFAPFRGTEFFFGMTLGYLLACRREEVQAWTTSAFDAAGLIVVGALLVTLALRIPDAGDAQMIISYPMLQLGLALMSLPILFKAPGRLEVSIIGRAVVAVGVVSFTALIVNDQMRYVASFLRHEGLPGAAWWFFIVVVYVPVGTLLAYPFAAAFGLLPSQRMKVRAPAPPAEASSARPRADEATTAAPRARRRAAAAPLAATVED